MLTFGLGIRVPITHETTNNLIIIASLDLHKWLIFVYVHVLPNSFLQHTLFIFLLSDVITGMNPWLSKMSLQEPCFKKMGNI